MTDSRQFKVIERSTPHSTVRAGQQARASIAGERSADDEVVRVILAAHDAAPSDLTKAVEALMRAGHRLGRSAPGSEDERLNIRSVTKHMARLEDHHPDFYKQAMEGTKDG